MPIHDKYNQWRSLLATNRINDVLQGLRTVLANSPHLDEVIHQSGRFTKLRENIDLGVIDYEAGQVTENQIRDGLLGLLVRMEEWEAEDPIVHRELAQVRVTGAVEKSILGSTVQAGGNVHIGDLIQQSVSGRPPHLLTPEPLMPEIFVGREQQIEDLRTSLIDPTQEHLLLLVNGEGGIGKTSLAAAYFNRYHQKYAHAAWVVGEQSIAGAILTLAIGLKLKFHPVEGTKERLHRLFTELANLDRPCLLVIDNANNMEDLDENYPLLRRCTNFHLLLTTRLDEYEKARRFPIIALGVKKALSLFEAHHRKLAPEEAGLFAAIHAAVEGNTLVLEILAKNLRQVNTLRERYSLQDLLNDLQQKGLFHLVYDQAVRTDYKQLQRAKPSEVIAAMYDLEALTKADHEALVVFAALPLEKIPLEQLELLMKDFTALEAPLLKLSRLGWLMLEKAETVSFRCSQVVQEVIRKKLPAWREMASFLAGKLIDLLETDTGNNLRYFKISEARLLINYASAIADGLEDSVRKSILLDRIGDFFRTSGEIRLAQEMYEQMRAVAHRLAKDKENHPDALNQLAISYHRLGETHSSMGNLPKALEFFETETELFEELHAAYPDNVGFKNGLAISYSKLGETHSSMGNLPKALEFFETETELFEELHAAYPDNLGFKNGLAISYEKLGSTHSSMGNLPKALEFFETETELFEELHAAYPDNVGFKNGLAISYSKLGSTHSSMGNLPKALEFFEQRSKIGQELHAAYPDNVGFKNGLAISYSKLGETHSSMGNLPKALEFFETETELFEELHAAYPDNVGFKNGLAISYEKLGETHSSMGNLPKALEFFETETELFEELHAAYPDNVGFKNGLAISYSKLGETHSSTGNLPKALEFFEQRSKIGQELHAAYPDNVGFKNGLAISYEKLGSTHSSMGNLPKALEFFETETELFEELHAAYPDNVGFKNGLAISYVKLGEVAQDPAQKRQQYQKAEQLWVELTEAFPDYAQFQKFLGIIRERLAEL